MLNGYSKRTFTAATANQHDITHDVYTRGDAAATVVIIQELPGIGPETLSLADTFVEAGFKVVLPHLFGPLGRIATGRNLLKVFCMRREFSLFARHRNSPIVDWLRALCQDLKRNHGASGIGVIGMCLTGNFAISMMADDHVDAGVASQPSMPINDQRALHMSDQDIDEARTRLLQHGPMLALRFEGDPMCKAEKFNALDRTFNDDAGRIKLLTLPGKGHSVLTLDLIKGGEPAAEALSEVLAYFNHRLKSA